VSRLRPKVQATRGGDIVTAPRDTADTPTRARDGLNALQGNALGAALVDAQTLADRLGVSRAFIYEHADELGALRLGSGPRARLRFDVASAIACYAGRESPAADAAPAKAPRRRRKRGMGTNVSLLPIRGGKRASEAAA
jgi:hypothetical protein